MEKESSHFGDSITISIEGFGVEFNISEGGILMNFHFHFADKSR